jgi:hypothetical protein
VDAVVITGRVIDLKVKVEDELDVNLTSSRTRKGSGILKRLEVQGNEFIYLQEGPRRNKEHYMLARSTIFSVSQSSE